MGTIRAIALAGAVLALTTSARAVSPAEKCEAAKLSIAGKYSFCRLKAEAKAVKAGGAPDYSKCVTSFTDHWTAAESKAGLGVCPSEGDLSSIANRILDSTNSMQTLLSSARFDASGATLLDHETGLEWERKDSADGVEDHNNPNDADNLYTWGGIAAPFPADGTAHVDFLAKLNGGLAPEPCYAGHCDWRLPTIEELETIADPSSTLAARVADPALLPNAPDAYWSSSSVPGTPASAQYVDFYMANTSDDSKDATHFARAVRSGRTPSLIARADQYLWSIVYSYSYPSKNVDLVIDASRGLLSNDRGSGMTASLVGTPKVYPTRAAADNDLGNDIAQNGLTLDLQPDGSFSIHRDIFSEVIAFGAIVFRYSVSDAYGNSAIRDVTIYLDPHLIDDQLTPAVLANEQAVSAGADPVTGKLDLSAVMPVPVSLDDLLVYKPAVVAANSDTLSVSLQVPETGNPSNVVPLTIVASADITSVSTYDPLQTVVPFQAGNPATSQSNVTIAIVDHIGTPVTYVLDPVVTAGTATSPPQSITHVSSALQAYYGLYGSF